LRSKQPALVGVRRTSSRTLSRTCGLLSYSSHHVGGVLVLTAEKALEGEELTAQREWLYKMIESREDHRYAIDLSQIDYMSSAEIGFLITLKRRIDAHKGKLIMFGVDSFILDIFRTMRLDKLFTFATDLKDAIEKLPA
jgi:anti-sigma B factor antagonist